MTQKRVKFAHLTKENILDNLNICIKNKRQYIINSDAFLLTTGGNLKHERIVENFKTFNIDINSCLKKNKELKIFFKDEHQINNISSISGGVIFDKINEIVDRRNQIAHGAELIDSILGISELEVHADFIEKYYTGIFNILTQNIISHEVTFRYKKLNKIKNVWGNNILGIKTNNLKIKIGDYIIYKTSKNDFFKAKVCEIQVNKIPYNNIHVINQANVTIKVDAKIKSNFSFYIKKSNHIYAAY